MKKTKLTDICKVIRSTNCSPFELTMDLIFTTEENFKKAKEMNLINREAMAKLYEVPLNDVLKVIYFDTALAVKMTMKRVRSSGSPGDSDVYGAQQHGPLLKFEFDF